MFRYPDLAAKATLLQNLKQRLSRWRHLDADTSRHRPLLDQDEILDLLFRTQARNAMPGPQAEVAHQRIGDARSIYRGTGLDYEESRPYQAGDEVRYMNWRATARSGELTMKVFREERRPGMFIVVDRRSVMRFGTRSRLKVTQAARAAACIAFAAQQRHASVGGVALDADPRWYPETCGERAAFDLVHGLAAPCPPVFPAPEEPSFRYVLDMLRAMLTPGTRLYLISDFHDLGEEDRPGLLQLAAQHPLHAIAIVDPAELHLPRAGRLRLWPPAGNRAMLVDTESPLVAKTYAAAAAAHFATRRQLLHSLNVSYTQLLTVDEAVEAALPLP